MIISRRVFTDNDIYQLAVISSDLIAINKNYNGISFIDSGLNDKYEIILPKEIVFDGTIIGNKYVLFYSYESAAIIIVECSHFSYKIVAVEDLNSVFFVPFYSWIDFDRVLLYDYSGNKYLINCFNGTIIQRGSENKKKNTANDKVLLSQIIGYNFFSSQKIIQRENKLLIFNQQEKFEKKYTIINEDVISCDVFSDAFLAISETQAIILTGRNKIINQTKPGFSFLGGALFPTSYLKYILLCSNNADSGHCELSVFEDDVQRPEDGSLSQNENSKWDRGRFLVPE